MTIKASGSRFLALLIFVGCGGVSKDMSVVKEIELIREVLPYAAMSELAYERCRCSGEQLGVEGLKKQIAFSALLEGWERVDNSEVDCPGQVSPFDGLHFQIWQKKGQSLLVIVFRGTDWLPDWWSNLAPLPKAVAYRLLERFGGPEPTRPSRELRGSIRKMPHVGDKLDDLLDKANGWGANMNTQYEKAPAAVLGQLNSLVHDRNVEIHVAGHSLGGGLAESLLYSSQCEDSDIPRIEKAYVFNASPMTKASIHQDCLEGFDANNVIRVEDEGEPLSKIREAKEEANKALGMNLLGVRTLTCDFEGRGDHSMTRLVDELNNRILSPGDQAKCETDSA